MTKIGNIDQQPWQLTRNTAYLCVSTQRWVISAPEA